MSIDGNGSLKTKRSPVRTGGAAFAGGRPCWPLALVLAGVLLAGGLWFWWSESGDWVVRVNVTPISEAMLQKDADRAEQSMSRMLGFSLQGPEAGQIREQIYAEVQDQLISRVLLQQAAIRAGFGASPEEVEGRVAMDMMRTGGREELEKALTAQDYTLDQYRQLVGEMIAISRLSEYVARSVAVGEDEVRAAYEAEQDQLTTPEQVKVGRILLETREKAAAVIAELGGGADFQQLADANSTDPAVESDHGILGYITQDDPRLPEAFREAAFSTQPGAWTEEPVQTELGWYVLYVYDKKVSQQISYEDVRDQLRQEVLASKKNEVFASYLDGLRKNSFIERRVRG